MIKEILVPMDGGEGAEPQLAAALALAKDMAAHIDALLVQLDPRERLLFLGEGVATPLQGELLETFESQAAKEEEAARDLFQALCLRMQVPVDGVAPHSPGCWASWRRFHGHMEHVLPHEGRLGDLIVLSAANVATTRLWRSVFAAALFGAGRPLLLAPPVAQQAIGATVAIAWDGGMQAARAVAAALPLLARASAVTIMTVDADHGPYWNRPERLEKYLAYHGIGARVLRLEAAADIGESLQAKAADIGADLLVMGGYGHGRLREWVLGGATRHVVAHPAMAVLIAN